VSSSLGALRGAGGMVSQFFAWFYLLLWRDPLPRRDRADPEHAIGEIKLQHECYRSPRSRWVRR